MAYIRVDHSKFETTAKAIDNYVDDMKSKMKSSDGEVNVLSSTWQGSDYSMFKTQWEKVTNDDSVYRQMVKSLEAYSGFLRFAAGKYKDAQADAVNRANSLPRW